MLHQTRQGETSARTVTVAIHVSHGIMQNVVHNSSSRNLELRNSAQLSQQKKHPRNHSASTTRSRAFREGGSNSVCPGTVDSLQYNGSQADVMPRNGNRCCCFHGNGIGSLPAFEAKQGAGQCEGVELIRLKTTAIRFQCVTDGTQRPPSRQKGAFPVHLADVVPYTAFQVPIETFECLESTLSAYEHEGWILRRDFIRRC